MPRPIARPIVDCFKLKGNLGVRGVDLKPRAHVYLDHVDARVLACRSKSLFRMRANRENNGMRPGTY
jgi:hypothetical protein